MIQRTSVTYDPTIIRKADPTENLNRLIGINNDSINGYREAAELVENETYATTFKNFAQERETFGTKLANMVTEIGGTPEADGNFKGMFHRMWMNLKTAVTNGDAALLDEIERGETAAIDVYNDVLETALTEQQRDIIVKQLNSIREARSRIEMFKAQLN